MARFSRGSIFGVYELRTSNNLTWRRSSLRTSVFSALKKKLRNILVKKKMARNIVSHLLPTLFSYREARKTDISLFSTKRKYRQYWDLPGTLNTLANRILWGVSRYWQQTHFFCSHFLFLGNRIKYVSPSISLASPETNKLKRNLSRDQQTWRKHCVQVMKANATPEIQHQEQAYQKVGPWTWDEHSGKEPEDWLKWPQPVSKSLAHIRGECKSLEIRFSQWVLTHTCVSPSFCPSLSLSLSLPPLPTPTHANCKFTWKLINTKNTEKEETTYRELQWLELSKIVTCKMFKNKWYINRISERTSASGKMD